MSNELVYRSRYGHPTLVLIYRMISLLIIGFTVISNRILEIIDGEPFANFRYFSIQNLHFIFLWLILAILYRHDELVYQKLGQIQGALLTYTLVVTVVYYVLLYDSNTGIELINDWVMHLVGTLLIIGDFVLSNNSEYEWIYPVYWLIYPVVYMIFSIIYDLSGGDSIYNFLTLDPLSSYLTWVVVLMIVFYGFGNIWVGMSKYLSKSN